MGIRFHKSIRLLPFLRLNLSKTGISFSLGAPGAMLNLGPKGASGSVGMPGTGLSYRKTLSSASGEGLSRKNLLLVKEKSGTGSVILRLFFLCALFAAGVYIYALLQS